MRYITFSQANCKNCYRCIRTCPVKAIKFKNHQAEIVNHRCIACGHCYSVCPHSARNTVSDLGRVKKALSSKKTLIASLPPSFSGAFNIPPKKLVSLLKKIGFSHVEETISGINLVSKLYEKYINENNLNNYISTDCPSVNYLIEKYYPKLIDYMLPVVSPMVAHSKLLRESYGNECFIVYIDPCIAKKIESEGFVNKGILDAVLTYSEILDLSKDFSIDYTSLEEANFDKKSNFSSNSATPSTEISKIINPFLQEKNLKVLSISGDKECISLFKSIEKGEVNNYFIQASMCKGGCVGGPNMITSEEGYYRRLQQAENYLIDTSAGSSSSNSSIINQNSFSRNFRDKTFPMKIASKDDLKVVMANMAKYSTEDELNCGVCGYSSCKEKAQAVFEGMSETTLCLQYMRSRAESLRNVIFESSLNYIILLDGDMKIKDMNPAAEVAFSVKAESIKNNPISTLIDDDDFRLVRKTGENIINKKVWYPRYNLECIETVVHIPKQNIVMVALIDITKEEANKKKLYDLTETTINAAQQVIEKQMRVAHEIASLLGETTAETKITLTKLKNLVKNESSSIL